MLLPFLQFGNYIRKMAFIEYTFWIIFVEPWSIEMFKRVFKHFEVLRKYFLKCVKKLFIWPNIYIYISYYYISYIGIKHVESFFFMLARAPLFPISCNCSCLWHVGGFQGIVDMPRLLAFIYILPKYDIGYILPVWTHFNDLGDTICLQELKMLS